MLLAILGLAALPAGVVAARELHDVRLSHAVAGAAAAAILLGALALWLARRARRQSERTLGRVGGERTARVGSVLGTVALLAGITAAAALAVFGVLLLVR